MKTWQGTPPKKCELGGCDLIDTFVDGKTRSGFWAIMCPTCHLQGGVGIGNGRGQRYLLQNNIWVKVAG